MIIQPLRQSQKHYTCFQTVEVNGKQKRLIADAPSRGQTINAMIDLMLNAGVPIGSKYYNAIVDNVEATHV